MKKILDTKEKVYGLLFGLSFFNFLLYSFYTLLSLVVDTISILGIILLLINLFCSIYFIVCYQYQNNLVIIKEKKKKNYKNKVVVTDKKKNYNTKNNSLKNKLINIFN